MAKKGARSEKKRTAIFEAATRAFRDEGYDSTSMDRVAELAAVSKRTVYNHFGSKEALFQAVIQHLIEQMHEAKKIPWDPDRTLEEQLTDFARVKAAVFTNPTWLGLLRVALGVFIRYPELGRETMCQAQAGEDSLVLWLEGARAAGRLKVEDVPTAAQIFWAMVSGALFWPTVFDMPLPPEERDGITQELVLTFLARYRAENSP